MRRTWTWTFDLPPDRLWPLLADTNRFNEAVGLPPYTLEQTPQPNGTVRRRGRGKAAGFTLEWEEKPYEWIAGRHFRQSRMFTKGPFRRFGPVFDLKPDGKGGSHVTYALEWEPLSLVGRAFGARLAAQAGEAVGKRTVEAVAFARGDNAGERLTPFELPPPELPPGARERAETLAREIDRSPYGNGLGPRLAEIVLHSMAADLCPSQTQGARGRSRRSAAGGNRGLPCRREGGASHDEVGPALPQLPRCQDQRRRPLRVAAWRALSLVQHRLRPRLREERGALLCAGTRCAAGCPTADSVSPARWRRRMSLCRCLLDPGERRNVTVDLPPGSYRLRTLHPGVFVDVDYESGPFPGLHITASGVEVLNATDPPGEAGSVAFVNDAGFELAALIEDRTWVRDALTAPEVISLQAFRDLFAEATLRPGDDAGVSQVALLFTDLQGSTALYERVGDAAAYNIVRKHFALLAAIVRDHDGAVVKTIGDAVMASFSDPAQAVRAALAMQAEIGSSARGVRDLVLKVGVHAGPSVVVTLNDRLDYFGSTVNMAARLQGQSTGGDIVLSSSVADDPAVREVLAAMPKRRETVALKGFTEPVGFIRLLPG